MGKKNKTIHPVIRLLVCVGVWLLSGIAVLSVDIALFPNKTHMSNAEAFTILFLPIVIAVVFSVLWKRKPSRTAAGNIQANASLPETAPSGGAYTVFTPQKHRLPSGTGKKEYAQTLLYDCKFDADMINHATDVFDFTFYYQELKDKIEKLAWLNEKKNVSMYPTPRETFSRVQENLENSINDFIFRAVEQIATTGSKRASDIERLVWDMENDDFFPHLMTEDNKMRLSQLKEQARQTRELALVECVGEKGNLDLSDSDAMKVITAIEQNIAELYQRLILSAASKDEMEQAFSRFQDNLKSSSLPLAAEIRLASLLEEYTAKFSAESPLYAIDHMDGHTFEHWCAALLEKLGYGDVKVTAASNDQGVDILAEKDGIRYAIQCKCYSSALGNTPIQEVNAGKAVYRCQVGAVMTNQHFTKGAKEAAEATGVLLWDRDWLQNALNSVERISHSSSEEMPALLDM